MNRRAAASAVEGHNLHLAYFAQDQAKVLDPGRTLLEEITTAAPFDMVPRVRDILGTFLFSGDDVHKKVSVLSGGERNRLALAILLLRPANLLLLDEPTNHLDLQSKEVLLDALKSYGGTLVFVSHDRYFVDALATRVVEVAGGRITSHLGNYEDFLQTKSASGEAGHSDAAGGTAGRGGNRRGGGRQGGAAAGTCGAQGRTAPGKTAAEGAGGGGGTDRKAGSGTGHTRRSGWPIPPFTRMSIAGGRCPPVMPNCRKPSPGFISAGRACRRLSQADEKRPSAALPSSFVNDVPSRYALFLRISGALPLGIFAQPRKSIFR